MSVFCHKTEIMMHNMFVAALMIKNLERITHYIFPKILVDTTFKKTQYLAT